jgi:MFS family permease
MAFSYKFWQLFLSCIGFGLSGAFVYAPCTAVAAHWFYRRRGTAISVMTCGSAVGGVVYPIMLARLLARLCELSQAGQELTSKRTATQSSS